MSKVKVQSPVQNPIVHLPSYKKWRVPGTYVDQVVGSLGLTLMYPNGVRKWYHYTDNIGRAALLPHLILKSDLYKADAFTCINYAFEVWNVCGKTYGLNTWVPVIGKIPGTTVRHAWNLIMVGDETGLLKEEFTYFEPNNGWEMGQLLELAYQSFPIGEEGYTGEFILY